MKLLINKILSFGVIIRALSDPIRDDETHKELVKKFIDKMKSDMDETADPCENFGQYACGNIKMDPFEVSSRKNIFDKYIVEPEPKTKVEKKFYDYHKDCKKYSEISTNLEDVYDQIEFLQVNGFPVNKTNLSGRDVAVLAAKIFESSYHSLFMRIEVYSMIEGNKVFLTTPPYFFDFDDRIENFFKEMNLLIKPDVIENIKKFTNRSRKVFKNNNEVGFEEIEINSLEKLKELLPSTNFDWETYIKEVQKSLGVKDFFKEYHVILNNLERFKLVMQLIDGTDVSTLLNVEIINFLSKFKANMDDRGCMDNIVFFNHLIYKKIWDEIFKNTKVIEIYKQFLDDVENDLKTERNYGTDFKNKTLRMLEIGLLKHIMANHSNILSDEILEKYLERYEYGKFYKNSLIYGYKGRFNDVLLARDVHNFDNIIFDDFISYPLKYDLDKPYLYFNSFVKLQLFRSYYEEALRSQNDDFKFMYLYRSCINGTRKFFEVGSGYSFISLNRAVKTILEIPEDKPMLQYELNIAKDFIDTKKIFFLSIAQIQCHRSDDKDISFLENTLRFSKYFTETFQCPKGSSMHQHEDFVCNFDQYCPNKNYAYLLPFELANC